MTSERAAARAEVEDWRRASCSAASCSRAALIAELERLRSSAARETDGVELDRQTGLLLTEREALSRDRLENDALAAALKREAATARVEVAAAEEQCAALRAATSCLLYTSPSPRD